MIPIDLDLHLIIPAPVKGGALLRCSKPRPCRSGTTWTFARSPATTYPHTRCENHARTSTSAPGRLQPIRNSRSSSGSLWVWVWVWVRWASVPDMVAWKIRVAKKYGQSNALTMALVSAPFAPRSDVGLSHGSGRRGCLKQINLLLASRPGLDRAHTALELQ
jgi:hypothetical protein